MLTFLEILIIVTILPVLVWALLPVKRVPRFLDFMPSAAVILMILHLFIDKEPVRFRFIPLYIFTITLFLVTIVKIFKHNPDQPKKKVRVVINRIFSLLLLTACVLIPTLVFPFYSLPGPTGEYNVGTVVSDFTDKNRIETFSKDSDEKRRIAVQFWYPTDRKGTEVQYDISGAPLSPSQQSYPVLIFSHGAFGMRLSNASTCRELASHGYIVASIDHTYHSFYTSFEGGKGVLVNNAFLNEAIGAQLGDLSKQKEFEVSHSWLNLRTADIELLIDSLKAGEIGEAGKLLDGHMDLNNIGLFGHSLGGASSAQVARDRDEVKAAIVIDGTMIGDITSINNDNKEVITDESFTKPLMQMYGSLYQDEKAKETSYLPNISAFNNSETAAYSLCINNSGHLNFTDLPRISPFLSKKLGIGSVDVFECIKTVNDYTLAFFDKHIKGEASSLLDGTKTYEGVQFDMRNSEGK